VGAALFLSKQSHAKERRYPESQACLLTDEYLLSFIWRSHTARWSEAESSWAWLCKTGKRGVEGGQGMGWKVEKDKWESREKRMVKCQNDSAGEMRGL